MRSVDSALASIIGMSVESPAKTRVTVDSAPIFLPVSPYDI
jgi:hypothetical protein